MGNTVNCPECNIKTFSTAKTCPNCGTRFPKQKKSNWMWWVGSIFIVLLLIGSCNNSLTQSQTNQQQDIDMQVSKKTPKEEAITKVILENFDGKKGGFGNILMADFKIKNGSNYSIKDIEITCKSYANSGTEIDSNNRVIYEIINQGASRQFSNFNMGFIQTQATSSKCEITNFQIIE